MAKDISKIRQELASAISRRDNAKSAYGAVMARAERKKKEWESAEEDVHRLSVQLKQAQG